MGTVFSAYDIRGRADESLTTEYAWNVGKALAEWLPEQGDIALVRGADASETLVHALTEGVLLQGRNVIDGGQGDQAVLTGAIIDKQAAGGVFVTHDALQSIEIIVLLDARGAAITEMTGLTELSQLVEAGNFVPAAVKGEVKPL